MAMTQLHSAILPSPTLLSKTHFPISQTIHFGEESQVSNCLVNHTRIRRRRRACWEIVRASDTGSVPETNLAAKKPKILVAGGGIGGLVFALAAKRKGFDVLVFERDLSAIRGEGQYRGPIQIQSNALAALEAIDLDVADEIMNSGCITGDRINGLVDGISGNWYTKFDTFTPAVSRGLPVTRVISRMTLQKTLAKAVGADAILNGSNVVDFVDNGNKVTVTLENGEQHEGDLLIGADGIRSKVRKLLLGPSEASYSGYTCYTGIADFVPPDIETVGYRVFLGHKQYFVSSDVGAGRMQWYAFHKEPAGGSDVADGMKKRLFDIFDGWCDNVIDLIHATKEEAVLRRDIYDKPPVFTWGKGRVTLLGDSVHAMQPNLGQGGCMAIEDSYQLAMELEKAFHKSVDSGSAIDIASTLRSYENARKLRVSIIYGLARMAANMATTYRPYLGVGLGPLSFLTKLRIPHPGRVGGRFFISLGMPMMLSWILGGNSSKLEGRSLSCRLTDKADNQLRTWFEDDDELERALCGEWYLFPMRSGSTADDLQPINIIRNDGRSYIVGNASNTSLPELSITLSSDKVSQTHARIHCKNKAFFLTDMNSQHGTWLSDNEGRRYRVPPNFPVRFRPSDVIEFGSDKKAMFRVKVLMDSPTRTTNDGGNQMLQAA
ncbi:Zeaxanthin epoxidase, chloroplastic [Zostera marina]|uniref:Zeaxanthin epoxidase, chloroplastic n=1 Tax=Zostera marina TaxID=29655 RepID=A0A0K9NLX6_ZOSMR|nr:Zeaxanthin epoxidase, chloroplastic [Zostera marina]